MNKIFKSSLVAVLAFLVMFFSAGGAHAAITIAATTITSGGTLTLATTGNFVVTPSAVGNTILIGLATGTGAITLGLSSGAQAVNIGTGTGTSTISIATGATNPNIIDIGTGAVVNTIGIGTGAAADINIGHATADVDITGASAIVAGTTDPLTITGKATSTWSTDAGPLTVTGYSALTLGTTGGNFAITPGAVGDTIVIGKTTGTGTITLGSSTGTQIVNIGAGTGTSTVALAGGANANTVNIAIGATKANTIAIGTGAVANNIDIGHASATTDILGVNSVVAGTTDGLTITAHATSTWSTNDGLLTISNTGTGDLDDINITSTSSGDITITAGDVLTLATTNGNFLVTPGNIANTIFIGKETGTGKITLGDSDASQAIDIGAGEGTSTIAIGTGTGSPNAITIGTGASMANTITIGTATASTVSITDDNWSITAAGEASFVSATSTAYFHATTYVAADAYRVTNHSSITASTTLTKTEMQSASFFPVDTTSNQVTVTMNAALDAGDVGRKLIFAVTAGGTYELIVAGANGMTVITAVAGPDGTTTDDPGDYVECLVIETGTSTCIEYADN